MPKVSAMKNTVKTAIVNNETFVIAPTYEEMSDQVLMRLAGQMLCEMWGSRCVSSEIEFILKHAEEDYDNAPFCRDDITNSEPTGEVETKDCYKELTEEQRDNFIIELEEEIEELEEESDEWKELQRLKDDAEMVDCGENYPEIMQWFALDDRLLSLLDGKGECTLDDSYWGRQAYGQSITMDHCIKQACYDLAACWAK